ncbi:heavy metal translocating P-type ATPase [Microvirga thermotolerans]|uniref:Cadmium-translocating P-type ATPase n=1 Tax=Microvirga thermotolerans TaxID=2651334 RepID=A0A5P9JWI6_9HYPH|nr:heavy metal translocating P-type ATPase [Microvirga thermotolerans]QFU16108.1 cadmium-translocating P-type ATPase [Microvirga thermotolerans]
MAETLDLSVYVKRQDDGTSHLDLAVEGIDCAACIGEIEGGLSHLPGLLSARLNYTTHRLSLQWTGGLDPARAVEELRRLGYRAHPFKARAAEEEETRRAQWLLKCLAVAGFASMNIMLLAVSVWSGNVTDISPETRDFFHWLAALISLPAVAYAGQPFFRSALGALRKGRTNMDVPITIGILLALVMSVIETVNHAEHTYFDSVVMLLFFLLCGRYLDQAMRRRTRAVAGNLASLRAEVAHRLDAKGEATLVPVAALAPGDRVLVRPGERIPVDGVVLSGTSEADESLVTGETALRALGGGDAVYAGSLNHAGALTVQVTAAGQGTLLDEVERLLDNASAAKSRYRQLADRVARAYAPVVHIAAALTAIVWIATGASVHDAVITAVAVLIITCPCALALAIPVVQVVASGALFRANVLLNSGDALERLASVDTVVFDKTGTLTLPEARIANTAAIRPDLLEAAARLALSSHHPLAAAAAREARDARPFEGAVEEPGKGVRAVVDGVELRLGSPAFCGAEDLAAAAAAEDAQASLIAFSYGRERAVLRVRQALRPDAARTVRALQALGLDCRILSGDRPEAVAPVAGTLGIGSWQGGAKPAEKIAVLERLKGEGRRILMVGDGLNDAPALAAADVSISPITAADLTQAQADAVFLGDRLAPVAEAVAISRCAHALMRQNLVIALVYNLFAVPLAFLGYVTPLVAALAMSGSSSLVTLNALRARGVRAPAQQPNASRRRSAAAVLQGA